MPADFRNQKRFPRIRSSHRHQSPRTPHNPIRLVNHCSSKPRSQHAFATLLRGRRGRIKQFRRPHLWPNRLIPTKRTLFVTHVLRSALSLPLCRTRHSPIRFQLNERGIDMGPSKILHLGWLRNWP